MVDKYIYPGTRVLINKLDIRDGKKLDNAEYSIVSLNINNLIRNPIFIRSLKDIFVIHKILFADLYEWAGNKRNINIYKEEPILTGLSVNYSDYNSINTDLNKLDKEFIKINWKELKKKKKIDKIKTFENLYDKMENAKNNEIIEIPEIHKDLKIKIDIDKSIFENFREAINNFNENKINER